MDKVRYARILTAVAAAAATATSALQGFSAHSLLISGATVVCTLVLMVLIIVLSNVPQRAALHKPAMALVWTAVITSMVVTAIVVVSACLLIADRFRKTDDPIPQEIKKSITEDDIPSSNREALPLKKSSQLTEPSLMGAAFAAETPGATHLKAAELRDELRKRGSITLDGNQLTLDPKRTDAVVINAYTFRMRNGASIVTNGRELEIRAVNLVIDQGSITSHHAPAPSGVTGTNGSNGVSGGRVLVAALDTYDGLLSVHLVGQAGGTGGPGTLGVSGPAGARGADAVTGLIDCRSGGQDGGAGGKGGPGGSGGRGGDGGSGGTLEFDWQLTDPHTRIQFVADGGKGGKGGDGGLGGPGGAGGQGGGGNGLCSGGRAGPSGPPGEKGKSGDDGNDGVPGKKTVVKQ
jgi:hypothetical protein